MSRETTLLSKSVRAPTEQSQPLSRYSKSPDGFSAARGPPCFALSDAEFVTVPLRCKPSYWYLTVSVVRASLSILLLFMTRSSITHPGPAAAVMSSVGSGSQVQLLFYTTTDTNKSMASYHKRIFISEARRLISVRLAIKVDLTVASQVICMPSHVTPMKRRSECGGCCSREGSKCRRFNVSHYLTARTSYIGRYSNPSIILHRPLAFNVFSLCIEFDATGIGH
jgi:hypothetical protein